MREVARADDTGASALVVELLELLDAERAKAEKKVPGLGYKAIVAGLRVGLGNRLALPQNPSTAWIVRQVNRARELGLDVEQIERLGKISEAVFRTGPVELEYVLRSAVRLLSQSDVGPGVSRQVVVVSGRSDPGEHQEPEE